MSNNKFTPAFPTIPFNDKFGQPVINFGMSKIEYATIIIAGQIAANNVTNTLPEAIVEEAYLIALSTFEKCEEEFVKMAATQSENTKIIS